MLRTFIAVVDGTEIAFALSYEDGQSAHADMMIAVLSSKPTFYEVSDLVADKPEFYENPRLYSWDGTNIIPPSE